MPDVPSDHPDTILLAAQLAAADGFGAYVPQAKVIIRSLPASVRLTAVEPTARAKPVQTRIPRGKYRPRLKPDEINVFRSRYLAGESGIALAAEYGVSSNYVFNRGWNKQRKALATNGHAAAAE